MSVAVFRTATLDDLDAIVELAAKAGAGVTTLQPDRAFLRARILRSEAALDLAPMRPGHEEYQFVVDADDQIIACSAIVARVGGFDPFYTYTIRSERLTHPPLGVDRTIDVLHLKRDHKGPSELCGLTVAEHHRGQGIARLASHGRLMFMAAFPERFADRTIAEIRGVQDEKGRSPFWEAVGSVFFAPNAFAELDMQTGLGNKDFIADLMPEYPIYLDLLSQEVREVVGRPHRDAEGAAHLLAGQGFSFANEVDIFDAGPILECATSQIGVIATAQRTGIAHVDAAVDGPTRLVATPGRNFRAVSVAAKLTDDGLVIAPEAASALQVHAGQDILVSEGARR